MSQDYNVKWLTFLKNKKVIFNMNIYAIRFTCEMHNIYYRLEIFFMYINAIRLLWKMDIISIDSDI